MDDLAWILISISCLLLGTQFGYFFMPEIVVWVAKKQYKRALKKEYLQGLGKETIKNNPPPEVTYDPDIDEDQYEKYRVLCEFVEDEIN